MNNRWGMVGLLLVVAAAFAFPFLGYIGALPALTAGQQGSGDASSPAGRLAPVDPSNVFGPVTTLQQAISTTGLLISLPSFLPTGTSGPEIHASARGICIVYYNAGLKNVTELTRGSIAIYIAKDGTSYSDPRVSSETVTEWIYTDGKTEAHNVTVSPSFVPDYVLLTINGNPGWGFDPVNSNGFVESGRVDWWVGNTHYDIIAQLPASTIAEIASSMTTP